MSYVYRCRSCGTSTAPDTRQAAEAARDEHRAEHHHGVVPAGDEVADAAPAPARRGSGWKVLIGIGLLVVAEAVARIYSRLR